MTMERAAFGLGLALVGSMGLGSAVAISRLAYAGGANGLSIALPRAWLLVLLLLIFCEATGRRLSLPPKIWLHCLGAGILLAYMFYGNIAAAEFIPAAVASLLFFIYPPLTTLLAAALDRRTPSPMKFGAAMIAFAGLAIMLGVDFSELDQRGLILGLAAGVFCAINITWVSRTLKPYDSIVTMTHMAMVAATGLTIAAIIVGGMPLPTTSLSWLAMLGAAILQAMSIPLIYVALPIIGAERSSILNNLQPVTTIVVAYFVLGETMHPAQFLGAGMVLGGILLIQHASKREAANNTVRN